MPSSQNRVVEEEKGEGRVLTGPPVTNLGFHADLDSSTQRTLEQLGHGIACRGRITARKPELVPRDSADIGIDGFEFARNRSRAFLGKI